MAGQAGGACVSASEVRGPRGACASARASEGLGVPGSKQGWAGGAGHEVCGQSVGCKGHHGIATGWPQGEHAYTGCVCKRVTVRQRCGEYGSKIALGFNHGKDQSQRGLGRALTQHDFHPEESWMHLRHSRCHSTATRKSRLLGHFYYKTKVKLTLFSFLTRGPK